MACLLRAWTSVMIAAAACPAAAPFYTPDSIVKAGDYSAGPFAPNSVVTIFGTDLSRTEVSLTGDQIHNGFVPTEMDYTQVIVDNVASAPLLYVSPTQINFLIPSDQAIGKTKVMVVRQGLHGPAVTIDVGDAAPGLFVWNGDSAIATHADNRLITQDSPAEPGEIVVVYATGLGKTSPNPDPGEIPRTVAQLTHLPELRVSVGGVELDPSEVLYAGLTPLSIGLYQLNLRLPKALPPGGEIRVTVAGQSSPAGLKLAIH